MSETWDQFAIRHSLHPKYGTLLPPDYKVTSFDYDTLFEANSKFFTLETDEQLNEFMQSFPDLHLKPPFNFADLLVMHDFTITIVSIYLSKKRKILESEAGVKISRNLAEPLHLSSTKLGMPYGFNTAIGFNYILLNDNFYKDDCSFGLKDFKLKVLITNQPYQELLFFGGLLVGVYYLTRINKLLFQCNQIIKQRPNEFEEIKKRLELCAVYWKKITVENQTVSNDFSADYFNNVLRPCLKGFNGVIFEGAEDGKDVIASTPGGTAGFQPSFQIFEMAFGINSKGAYHDMQINLQKGMPDIHKQCIKYFKEESLVRQYCCQCDKDVKDAYNKVVKAYGGFLRIHSEFMTKFILDPMKKLNKNSDQTEEKGTAGTLIMSIIFRYQDVESQVLK